MSETSNPPAHGSESENPAIDTPTPKGSRPRTVQDWWPDQLDLKVLKKHSATTDSSRARKRGFQRLTFS